MDLRHFLIFLSLLAFSGSQPSPRPVNQTDLQTAINDMRSKSYHGFVMLLKMLNSTAELGQDVTFLMPTDPPLSEYFISPEHIQEFMLSHSIPMPLVFEDLSHFPSGTLVPSGLHERSIRIMNRGRGDFFVNNARINRPNVCFNSLIRCHGIDTVMLYEDNLNHRSSTEDQSAAAAAPMKDLSRTSSSTP